MSEIEINIKNFNGTFASFNSNKKINTSVLDIIRSYISVGCPAKYNFPYFLPNIFFRLFMTPGMLLLLNFNKGINMRKFFFDFDMSEKSIISYYLGMTFTKYVYEKQLNIPWLINIDYLIKTGKIKLSNGKSKKGDLIGKDINNNWHVVEAKGRSNNPEKGLMTRAKNQAIKITHIDGNIVSTNSGSIVNLKKKPIHVTIEDPVNDKNGIKIKFNENYSFFKTYYLKYINFMDVFGYESLEYKNNKYDYFSIGSINNKEIIVGILSSLHKNPENAIKIIEKTKFPIETDENISIGKDGIILMFKEIKKC